MNKLATIVPVFGIGALNSGLTLIDDNESSVKSLLKNSTDSPVGVNCGLDASLEPSYKNAELPVKRILSLVGFSALK